MTKPEIDAEGLEAFRAWYRSHTGMTLFRNNARQAIAAYLAATRTSEAAEPVAVPEWWLLRGFPVRAPNDKRKGRIASEVKTDGTVFVDYPAGGGRFWAVHELTPWEDYRDVLGRRVREAWVDWAKRQPSPKPSWLVPYDELSEPDKEADRQIGEALVSFGRTHPSPVCEEVTALAVFAQFATENFTVTQLEALEAVLEQAGITLQRVGEWSALASLRSPKP